MLQLKCLLAYEGASPSRSELRNLPNRVGLWPLENNPEPATQAMVSREVLLGAKT